MSLLTKEEHLLLCKMIDYVNKNTNIGDDEIKTVLDIIKKLSNDQIEKKKSIITNFYN